MWTVGGHRLPFLSASSFWWQAELRDQVRPAAEDEDAGYARVRDREDAEAERAMDAAVVADVRGRRGLSVGGGGDQPPVPGRPDRVGEEAQARRAAGEPGAGTD